MRNGAIRRPHYAWLILVACCFMQAGTMGIMINCQGLFPNLIAQDLRFDYSAIVRYTSIPGLTLVFTIPLAGRFLPRVNFRLVCSAALLVCILCMASMAFFTQVWMWYVAGAVLGLAGGFLFSVPVSVMITNWFYEKRGLAMGIATAFSGIGGAVFNPLASEIAKVADWRTAYIALAVISAVLVLPFTVFVIRFKPEQKGLLPYGVTSQEELTRLSGAPTGGAAKKMTLFSPPILLIVLFSILVGLCFGFSQHVPMYADIHGMASLRGTLVSCVMIGNLGGKLLLGRVADRLSIRTAAAMGLTVVIVSFILLSIAGLPTWLMFVTAVLYGVVCSVASVIPPLMTRAMCSEADYSQLVSWSTGAVAIATAAGISIFGTIVDGSGSFNTGFIGAIISSAAAIVVAFVLFGVFGRKKAV